MSIPIRVLVLDDSPDDAELMLYELRHAGFNPSWRRIETESGYLAELEQQPEVILADYRMPELDAPLALQLLLDRGLDIPFIVVSGAIGEDIAVSMMRQGATDCVLKDRLIRLGPAVRRALSERRLRLEKRRAEEELRKSTEEIYDLYNHAPCGYHSLDPGGIFVRVNDTELSWLGYERDELIGTTRFTALVTPETRPSVEAVLSRLRTQGVIRGLECGLVRKNKSVLPVLLSAAAVRDSAGRFTMCRMTIHDITERRRAEAAMTAQEALLRSVLESLPVGVWVWDMENRLSVINRAGQAIRGGTKFISSDQAGAPERSRFPDDTASRAILRGESSIDELIEVELPDKTRKIILNSTVPMFDTSRKITGAIVVAQDITDRRKMEESLLQSQKMEAVGQLAGGVAHDFNNLLTIITGYSALLAESERGTPASEYAGEIVNAAARAADLTTRLLAFSRRQVVRPRIIDLNTTISNAGKMLRRLIGEDIELEIVLAPDIQKIKADPIHIEQILLNLASNARDAMPRGGKLTITTAGREATADAPLPKVDLPAGTFVALSVTDTGTGMDRQTLARVFEPFFTTKPQNAGTGLGLSTVRSIVLQNHGDLSVWSEPGRGASFIIYFPGTSEAETAPAPAAARTGGTGNATILLVEDDPSIRTLVARVLEGAGYNVLKAGCAREALDHCTRYGEEIHLLLTDVVMPGLTGPELADNIQALRPSIHILYMSGCTENWIQEHGAIRPDLTLVPKPILPETLLYHVREALQSGQNKAISATRRSGISRKNRLNISES